MIGSPFKCGGAVVAFPEVRIGGKLTVRVEKGTGLRVHLAIGKEPTSEVADLFLEGGEATEILGSDVTKASQVRITDISGDPNIYWLLT